MRQGILLVAAMLLASCAGDDPKVPADCEGAYKIEVEKTTYVIMPGGGLAPEHCARFAITLEEHLEKRPLPRGYVNCRMPDGRIVGTKLESCTGDGGKVLR